MSDSESFRRIASAVAPIFLAQGFAGVSLRGLASSLGIKAASLYHHCPGGKSELYVRSLEIYLSDYREGLAAAVGRASFPNALFRMADWMVEHPPVDIAQVMRLDVPHLEEESAAGLVAQLHDAVLQPFTAVLEAGKDSGAVRRGTDVNLAAAAVVSLVDGLGFSHLPPDRPATKGELVAAKDAVGRGLRLLLGGVSR